MHFCCLGSISLREILSGIELIKKETLSIITEGKNLRRLTSQYLSLQHDFPWGCSQGLADIYSYWNYDFLFEPKCSWLKVHFYVIIVNIITCHMWQRSCPRWCRGKIKSGIVLCGLETWLQGLVIPSILVFLLTHPVEIHLWLHLPSLISFLTWNAQTHKH